MNTNQNNINEFFTSLSFSPLPNISSTTPATPTWMSSINNIEPLENVNNGFVNKGYEPMKEENVNGEQTN